MKKYHTYFFDIDGTIFKYRTFGKYESTNPELTPGAWEKLREIRDAGHTIVLTTARPESLRLLTVLELEKHVIPYDQLVMGLPRGPRHVINDMSLTVPGPRAIAWNVRRDEGLEKIQVEKLGEDNA